MDRVRQKRRSYRDRDDEDALGDELAAVNERLDELTRHIERIAQTAPGRRSAAEGGPSADQVAEALARLDRRLDQVIGEGCAAPHEPPRYPVSSTPAPALSQNPDSWAAQIAARQRVLDGETPSETVPPGPQPVASGSDLTGVEQQLRDITTQIASLQQPCQDAFAALRHDLAEASRVLTEAVPRRTVEALEEQLGSLAERIDRSPPAGSDSAALAGLEQGLAEVRDALHGLSPAESLAGVEEAVRGLSYKIDQIGLPADPAGFKQLEQAVVSLRDVMSNVASEGTLAELSAEVHGLASGLERTAVMPAELDGTMRSLSERIDRITLSQGDQLAVTSLEERIAKLSEKLDTTDGPLGRFDAIERGLADLLVHLEEIRGGGLRAAPSAQNQAETTVVPEPASVATPEPELATFRPAPAGPAALPLDLIAAAAEFEAPRFEQSSPPLLSQASTPPAEPLPPAPPVSASAPSAVIEPPQPSVKPNARPRLEPRRPIDPNLPPDTPIEPGGGVPRLRSSSAVARIAASEAVLGGTRLMPEEINIKSAAIAAARNALKSTYLDPPAKAPRPPASEPRDPFKWFKRARKTQLAPPSLPKPSTSDRTLVSGAEGGVNRSETSGNRVVKRLKTFLIAASVAIIVVGAVQTVLELLLPGDSAEIIPPTSLDAPASPRPATTHAGSLPAVDAPPTAAAPSQREPDAPHAVTPAPPNNLDTTRVIEPSPPFFDSPDLDAPKPPSPDATGSIASPLAVRPAAARPPAATPSDASNSVLRTAIAARDPAAEYEMASRHAEGRGVPQNLQEAARWFERAANAGFVPAQFRLAGLHEKGEGLKKDVQAARRLYLAAANKGHAKAMHNLAVLYAEGVDGKPDYKAAAQWFRKAAVYGIADSQYNIAILHARGIGVEANLAESYKWFALAARGGDPDSAKKRDEVGARLDPQSLMAAKLAVQTFAVEREPDEATSLRTPQGGWDRVSAQPPKPRPRAAASPTR
jgi:localization factor PodJL